MSDPKIPPTDEQLAGAHRRLEGLSVLDDLTGLLHGKGGLHKIPLALDIVEQIAGAVGALVPGVGKAVAAGIVEAAEMGKTVVQNIEKTKT